MDELQNLKDRMEQERPTAWKDLPDIALYMDQLISYMPRQLIRFDEGNALTSAMVNNYIKDGLVPRAEGKRYGPVHLGYLTAVVALKQVLTVRDIGALMGPAGRWKRPRRSSTPISAAPWIRPSPTPPGPSTRRRTGPTWPKWPWTWLCAATPTSWPASVSFRSSSPRRRKNAKKSKRSVFLVRLRDPYRLLRRPV